MVFILLSCWPVHCVLGVAVGREQDNVHKFVQKENICDIWRRADAAWSGVKFVEPRVCMDNILFIL